MFEAYHRSPALANIALHFLTVWCQIIIMASDWTLVRIRVPSFRLPILRNLTPCPFPKGKGGQSSDFTAFPLPFREGGRGLGLGEWTPAALLGKHFGG